MFSTQPLLPWLSLPRLAPLKPALAGLSLVAAALLSGCSAINPDFTSMTESYERAIDIHQNKSLLANMLRASRNLPLVFTDITTVAGTGGVATNASASANFLSSDPGSIPGFFTPNLGSAFGVSSGLTTNRSFTFSLGSLNNEEFYKGFLTETPLEDVYFYVRTDNTPMELMMSLLVDSIQMVDKDGKQETFYNDPFHPEYERFKRLMYALIDDGLTAEMREEETAIGPRLSSDSFHKIRPELSKLLQGKLTIKKISANPEAYQLVSLNSKASLCFSSVNVSRRFGAHLVCGQDRSKYAQSAELGNRRDMQKETLAVRFRSTKGVFYYLGKVIALQEAPTPRQVTVRTRKFNGEYVEEPVLRVIKGGAPSGNTIASVNYYDTQYSVPLHDGGYSAAIFQLMSVMVSMNNITGSIPSSPGVLIR